MKIQQMIEITATKEDYFSAEGMDISIGGFQIRTSSMLDPLARIYFMIELDLDGRAKSIDGEGYVSWIKENEGSYNAGIQFYSLTSDQKAAIEEYCAGAKEEA
jgi:c-di-GMP-binding flagellar brake protein YcgR